MPRLHPDDLAELIKGTVEGLKPTHEEHASKQAFIDANMSFTPEEAALMLNQTPRSIYNHCKKGIIKAFRTGGEWRISKQTIIDLQNGTTSK